MCVSRYLSFFSCSLVAVFAALFMRMILYILMDQRAAHCQTNTMQYSNITSDFIIDGFCSRRFFWI